MLRRTAKLHQHINFAGHKTKTMSKKRLKQSIELKGTRLWFHHYKWLFYTAHSHLIHCRYKTVNYSSFKDLIWLTIRILLLDSLTFLKWPTVVLFPSVHQQNTVMHWLNVSYVCCLTKLSSFTNTHICINGVRFNYNLSLNITYKLYSALSQYNSCQFSTEGRYFIVYLHFTFFTNHLTYQWKKERLGEPDILISAQQTVCVCLCLLTSPQMTFRF